jgi:phage FluMu gp28-like protein
MKSPLDLLKGYQRRYHDDPARFKAWLAARQVGKSFTSSAEPVADCAQAEIRKGKTMWVALSAGERQALEWLEKAKQWTEAFELSLADVREERDGGSEALLKQGVIEWPNGSRIIALPANPNTARGYSANLILDEFAFHEDPDAIWRACYPIISNPLRGELKLRVLSTPNGTGNKFHDIVTANKKFSVHKTTIYDAARELAPGREAEWTEELREGMADPDGWAQEYECQFVDSAAILFPYELLALCESTEANITVDPSYWSTPTPFPVDLGIDFARKRDLSVCLAMEAVADLGIVREVMEMKAMSTPDQIEHLRPRIRKARRVCLDYTGPGVGLGDFLAKEFGEWNPAEDKFGKIELCTFTQGFKQDVFPKAKMALERRGVRIPVNRVFREDMHSVQRVTTANGNVTYRAPHTEDGHSDRATAFVLAVRAQSFGGGKPLQYSGLQQSRMGTGRRRGRAAAL